ncbi:MAG: GNAT family N-acetyltransferase [Acidimicrobiales bacterium]
MSDQQRPEQIDPVPAVVELDGWSLQPLVPDHAPLVAQLLGLRGNRYILEMAPDVGTIRTALAELPRQPWSLPLAIVRDEELVGVATTALPNVKALHASLVALFVDPPSATLGLAMAVRHLLWSFPLHRLHAQVPAMDLTTEYVDLFRSVGFEDEGRFTAHAMIAGQPFDMVVLGLLRTDFERWCVDHEPRLRLT